MTSMPTATPSPQLVDATAINQALALVEGIGPTDAIEAMTATMLVAAAVMRLRL